MVQKYSIMQINTKAEVQCESEVFICHHKSWSVKLKIFYYFERDTIQHTLFQYNGKYHQQNSLFMFFEWFCF